MFKKNAICIIPARAGSKRIKNKNIVNFNNRPLISYSINIARESKLFKRIIVSTDNKNIKKIALKYGAEVPFIRPKKLSDDFTGTTEVLKHAISEIKSENIEYHFCIYPTAPLINASDLKKAYNKIKKKNYSHLIATNNCEFNPLRSFKINKDVIKFKWPKFANKRSQDLEKLVFDSGTFYIYKTKDLKKSYKILPQKTTYYNIDRFRAIDINYLEDLKFAEFLYQYKKKKKK